MNILRMLRDKPWLHPQQRPPPRNTVARTPWRLCVFCCVLSSPSSASCSSSSSSPFCRARSIRTFEALAGQPWQPFTDPSRLWFNTALLACASLAIQWGLGGTRTGKLNVTVAGISAAVFFTVLFLVAQFDLWLHLQSMGFYMAGNPANSYFYLLTAIHGLHLIGGLVVLSNVVFRVWYDSDTASLSAPLQLCTTYWHFLLGVWLVLFALLTSRPETINALAALCGF